MKAPKQLDLPPAVARAFFKDMRAYFAEENLIKRDTIAARQLHALRSIKAHARRRSGCPTSRKCFSR
jgi:hypothetical protein